MSGSTVTLRPGVPADVPAVLDFWRVAAEDAHRPADDAGMVTRLIERDPDALLLAECADGIVGSLIAGWDGWRFHLYRLAVHPAHRGLGIARRLADQAERRFAEHGATRADAMVLAGNELAHRFWSANGYTPQAEWRRWVKYLDPGREN